MKKAATTKAPDVLKSFKIQIVGPNAEYTDQLYANGRQQCTVSIEVLKVESGGKKVELSKRELESLTVRPYSDQLLPSMPLGWYCDTSPNTYTQGSWRGRTSAAEEQAVRPHAAPAAGGKDNSAPEVIERYLRCDDSKATARPHKFMACITLDGGKQYTTHYSGNDGKIDFFVTISPQEPHRVQVKDLVSPLRDQVFEKPKLADLDIYYWTLPGNLRIREERYSGAGYEGPKLQYAYVINGKSENFAGAAIAFDATSLRLGEMGDPPKGVDPNQTFLLHGAGTTLRAARCWYGHQTRDRTYDNNLLWSITDNYGCVSTFVLKATSSDKGNTLTLVDS